MDQKAPEKKIRLGGCLTGLGLLGCLIFLIAPGVFVIPAIVILILLGVDTLTAFAIVFIPATIIMIIVAYLDLVVFADKADEKTTETEAVEERGAKALPPSGFDQWSE